MSIERGSHKDIWDTIMGGMVIVDSSYKIVDVNPDAIEKWRIKKDTVVGSSIFERVLEEDRERLKKALQLARENGNARIESIRLIHPDGKIHPVEIGIHRVEDFFVLIVITREDFWKADTNIKIIKSAIENLSEAIVVTDVNGTIQFVNSAFEKLTGYSPEEAIGQNPRILKSGKHPREFYKEMWDTILSGKIWHGELINKRKDGSLYWEEMTIVPVKDESGRVVNFVAVKHDVTERKKLEEKLQKEREFYRSVIESSPDGIFVETLDGKIIDLNERAAEMLGYRKEELLGKNVAMLLPEETRSKLSNVSRILRKRRHIILEVFNKHKKGYLVPLELSINLVTIGDKELVIIIARDLSQRHDLEIRYRAIGEMARDAIVMVDSEGRIEYWNPAAEKIFGYPQEEILGKKYFEYLVPKQYIEKLRKKTPKIFHPTQEGFKKYPVLEVWAQRKNGEKFPLEISPSIFTINGKPHGLMIGRDISQRKKKEQEILQRTEELQALYNFAKSVTSELDLQRVYRKSYRELRKIMEFDHYTIALCDEERKKLEVVFSVEGNKETTEKLRNIPLGDSITGWIVKNKKTLLIKDMEKEKAPTEIHLVGWKPRSWLGVPLLYKDKAVGALIVQSKKPNMFGNAEKRVLETLASQLAVAVMNAKLYTETEMAKERLENLINTSLVGIITTNLKDEVMFTNQKFGEMLGYSVSEITGKNIADFTTEEGLKIIKENTRKVLQGKSISYESVLRRKDGTLIDVLMSASPLKDSKGKIVGSVGVITDITERKRWEESIQRVNRVLSSLYNISLKMGGFPDLKRMCNIIYEELKNVLDFNWLSISIYNREDDTLYFPIMKSEMENADVSDTVIKCDPAKSLTAWVVKHRKPLLIRNLPKERPPGSFMIAGASGEEMNMEELDKSEVIVPIIYKDEVLGTIGISHPEEGAYSEEIVRYLSTIANFLAIFIANYNLYREIKKTKDMYETLINNSLVGIILTDLEDKILFANQKFAEMLGYSDASEVIGRNIREFATEAGYRKIREGTARRMKGISDSYETVLLTKDGKNIDVLIHASPLRDSDGKIIGTIGVNMDITERKRMEQRIREEWERYKGLMEKLLTGVVVIQDEKIVYVNKFMADMLGYRVEELIGEHFTRAVHPDMKEYLLENYHRRLSGEDIPESYIVKFIKRNGETVWALVRATLVEWEGKIADMVSVEDITRIKEMEDSLITLVRTFEDIKLARSEEEIYDIALNTLYNVLHFPYAAIAKITDGEIRIAKHRGYRNPNIILRLDDKKGISVWVVKHNEPYYAPDVTKDPLYVEGAPGAKCEYATPISAKDKVYGVLDVQREEVDSISEDERLLLDMLASHIGVALAGLEAMKEVEKARDLQELMVHIISHDLKNPLAVLSGYIDLLREMPSEEFLDAMEDAIKEAEEIIERARLFSKLGRKKIDEKREVINLRKFIEDAASLILKKYEGKELEIKIKDDLEITAYPILSRVFTNLIDNAFKYGATKVVVDAKDEGAMVEVRVADNGPGIPDEKKKKIFEPFERASRRKGSGLGLTIVKMIVELHGGEVWVEDNTPKGSVFVVRLPKE